MGESKVAFAPVPSSKNAIDSNRGVAGSESAAIIVNLLLRELMITGRNSDVDAPTTDVDNSHWFSFVTDAPRKPIHCELDELAEVNVSSEGRINDEVAIVVVQSIDT